jgi:hypothetical protein
MCIPVYCVNGTLDHIQYIYVVCHAYGYASREVRRNYDEKNNRVAQ